MDWRHCLRNKNAKVWDTVETVTESCKKTATCSATVVCGNSALVYEISFVGCPTGPRKRNAVHLRLC